MAIEAALIKPIVDVVLAGLKKIKGVKVKKDAASALSEVIRNLIQLSPDINSAEAKIQAAKAAGIISKELILAEKMLTSVKIRPRAVAKKAVAKRGHIAPKPAAKKTVVGAVRKSSTPNGVKKSASVTTKRVTRK